MKLTEMSGQYRQQSRILGERLRQLQAEVTDADDERTVCLLRERIRMLAIMKYEAQELAVLTGRYYERGYRRNGRYTL